LKTVFRGMALGAGYALALASVEAWLFVHRLVSMNLPPITTPAVLGSLLELALGAVLGLLLSPLLRLRLGWLWHLAALALVWFGLSHLTTPQSDFLFVVFIVPPAAGFVLCLVGHRLARFRRWLPATLGVLAVLAAIGFSEVRHLNATRSLPDVATRPPAQPGAPDIVLIVLDTVRAANVSSYGYERDTTPTFDTLAREGALFLDATAPSTWSLPSHASLFTGLFPSGHGAHQENRKLSEGPPMLAETLADAGYQTVCFTANAWISESLGTARGFEYSDESWRGGNAGRLMMSVFRLFDYLGFSTQDKGGADVASNFESWLEARPEDAPPLFVFINFLEAHFPYHQLPDGYLREYTARDRGKLRKISMQLLADQFGDSDLDPVAARDPARDMYDGGIRYSDELLRRVTDGLRRRGSLDSTVLVVLSDHGELLGEHGGYGHGPSLYEPVTRVPLLVRYPPRIEAGTRVDTPVSTVGVKATLLELAGVEPQGPLHVSSLLPALEGRPAGAPVLAERFAVTRGSQSDATSSLMRRSLRHRSYRVGTKKLIETSEGETFLFDLALDPDEKRDLAASEPAELSRLVDELATWRAALGLPALDADIEAGAAAELDPAARERLRSLGYVE